MYRQCRCTLSIKQTPNCATTPNDILLHLKPARVIACVDVILSEIQSVPTEAAELRVVGLCTRKSLLLIILLFYSTCRNPVDALMTLHYSVDAGYVDQETSWVMVLRGRTQFDITVHHREIEATDFGDQYLQLIKDYTNELNGCVRSRVPLRFICDYCLPLLEQLAPQASLDGFTVEDVVRSPTYTLEIVREGVSREARIASAGKCSLTPAMDISPLPTTDLPASCSATHQFRAEEIIVNVDNDDTRGSVQGRVTSPAGRSVYFKPRESGRETEFLRELCILNQIEQTHSSNDHIKLPDLQGIVVSGKMGEECVGLLINLITGQDLLSARCWKQWELHRQWEQQVKVNVEALHAKDIVWGDVNAGNVIIDEELNAWVVDFGGRNNPEFVDDDKAETIEGDWQGVKRLFEDWLPSRRAGIPLP